MNFFIGKNLKLRELEDLDKKINELLADENRTTNTDSLSRLYNERRSIMRELNRIHIAEEQRYLQPNPRDGRLLINEPNQPGVNVHEENYNI